MQRIEPLLDSALDIYQELLPEFDQIVYKNSKDKKWFVLNQEGRLALQDRPESIFALVIEAVSRIWDYIVSFFVTVKHPLQDKFVSLADRIERYLEREKIQMRASDFLNGYSQCINEIFRAAARMSRAGLLSDHQMRTGHPCLERYILTSQNERGEYTTRKKIDFRNALPDAAVELRLQGEGWKKSFERMKPHAKLSYTLEQEGFITPKVSARVFHELNISDLSTDYTIGFDPAGQPTGVKIAKPFHPSACQLLFTNNTSLPKELVLKLAGEVKETITLLPDQRWQFLVDKREQAPVILSFSYELPEKSLWLGCKDAVYTCTIMRAHVAFTAEVSSVLRQKPGP